MIANGSPQMLAIVAIKNNLEVPFRSFIIVPLFLPVTLTQACYAILCSVMNRPNSYGVVSASCVTVSTQEKLSQLGVTFLKLGTLCYGGFSNYGRCN